MKHLLIAALFAISANALADEKPTCELKADHWYKSTNLTIAFTKPMSFDECLAKGQDMFDSVVSDGTRIINPIKNTVTNKTWTTQYKQVKIVYRAEDGSKETKTLKRNEVVKSPVTVKVEKVKSGYKCWTQDECEVVTE